MAYKIFMRIDAAEEVENTKIRYTESKINCLQGY